MQIIYLNNSENFFQNSVFFAFLFSYWAGILVNLTPCIYPLIPIIIAYIGSKIEKKSKIKSFFLSLSYVLGLAVTYTLLGLFSALTGQLFGQIQVNPWTNFFIANIYLLLGLSMLDVISINIILPIFKKYSTSHYSSLIGSFLIGATSGLIMGPCTTPILASILLYVATKQNIILGMSLLFTFALGMGTILLILGTFSGILLYLPKSGPWMIYIKKFFGIIMIIIAEYFLIVTGQYWI